MRNFLRTGIIALLAVFALSSCNDDKSYYYDYRYSYGNIVEGANPGDYSIELDNGTELIVQENRIPNVEVTDQERVFIQYTLLGEVTPPSSPKKYNIELVGLDEVLEKNVVLQSEVTPAGPITEETLGNDPITVELAFFGGKYLNLEFTVWSSVYSTTTHTINLVWNNVAANPYDPANLTIRHNANGDAPLQSSAQFFRRKFGRVSIDVSAILPVGSDNVPVKIMWVDYGNSFNTRVDRYLQGTFSYTPSQAPINLSVEKPSILLN